MDRITVVAQAANASRYAESWRFKKAEWGPTAVRVKTGASYWKQPLKWNKETWRECLDCGYRGVVGEGQPFYICKCGSRNTAPTRQRVFCASMGDVFEDNQQVANWRGELFQLIERTPNLDWLLLTKRPEKIFSLGTDAVGEVFDLWLARNQNVWLGASVESPEYFEARVRALVGNGAAVNFLSVEPMLGPVRLVPVQVTDSWWEFVPARVDAGIDWVICGGESGKDCRAMDVQWARDLRDDCKTWGVKFFMKQMGGFPNKREGLEDLPVDLRVREMPDGKV